MTNNNHHLIFVGIWKNIISTLVCVSKILFRTDVSLIVFGLTEYFKTSFDRALFLQRDYLKKNETIAQEIKAEYIFSLVEKYPVESAYINNYVLPSLQFTAIFQIGSNLFLVHYNNVMIRGFLKATSSMSILLLKQIENNEQINLHKVILPFFKEPAVSTCKLILPENLFIPGGGVPSHSKKFVCNLVGEASHNFGKTLFDLQKLDISELAKSIPIKSAWKTTHQGLESILVSGLGNPFGFYVGSLVPRSWGSALLEEVTDTHKNISLYILYTSAQDYFFESLPNMSGVWTFSFFEEN